MKRMNYGTYKMSWMREYGAWNWTSRSHKLNSCDAENWTVPSLKTEHPRRWRLNRKQVCDKLLLHAKAWIQQRRSSHDQLPRDPEIEQSRVQQNTNCSKCRLFKNDGDSGSEHCRRKESGKFPGSFLFPSNFLYNKKPLHWRSGVAKITRFRRGHHYVNYSSFSALKTSS